MSLDRFRVRNPFHREPPPPPVVEPPLPRELRESRITVAPEEREFISHIGNSEAKSAGFHSQAEYLAGHDFTATVGELAVGSGIAEQIVYRNIIAMRGVFTLTQPHQEITLPQPK